MEVEPSLIGVNAANGAGGREEDSNATASDRCDGNGPRRLDPVAGGLKDRDPKKWSEVSWKSISLARQERGGTRASDDGPHKSPTRIRVIGASGDNGVNDGTKAKALRDVASELRHEGEEGEHSEGEKEGTGSRGGRRRAFQDTEASAMRQHARLRECEILAGGAQNFYKPVRVCGSCFRVSGFNACFRVQGFALLVSCFFDLWLFWLHSSLRTSCLRYIHHLGADDRSVIARLVVPRSE